MNRARELRNNATDAERKLWPLLKSYKLSGTHFRRQVEIGNYIADFACLKARLVVELDGGQHATDDTRDETRSAWLESQGFKVMRFWNPEGLENAKGVAETIIIETETRLKHVASRTSKRPPP